MIDSIFRTSKIYYFQVILEKNVNKKKKKKIPKYITNDIEICADEFDKEDSDDENCDDENSDKENHIEE